MRSLLLLPLVVAACGGGHDAPDATTGTADAAHAADARVDAPSPPDAEVDAAPAPDLACLGQPPPAGTVDPATIHGHALAVVDYQVQPAAGATVELRRRSDDGLIGQATAGADGSFDIDVPGAVEHGYFVVTATGYRPTYGYYDVPLPASIDPLIVVASAGELATWYGDAGATYTSAARTVVTLVTDCTLDVFAGSTITLAPAAPVTYYDPTAMQWDPAITAATNGFALATATAASVAITAHLGATEFPVETAPTHAGALTMVVISPYD